MSLSTTSCCLSLVPKASCWSARGNKRIGRGGFGACRRLPARGFVVLRAVTLGPQPTVPCQQRRSLERAAVHRCARYIGLMRKAAVAVAFPPPPLCLPPSEGDGGMGRHRAPRAVCTDWPVRRQAAEHPFDVQVDQRDRRLEGTASAMPASSIGFHGLGGDERGVIPPAND
jgi:hypothetical protein